MISTTTMKFLQILYASFLLLAALLWAALDSGCADMHDYSTAPVPASVTIETAPVYDPVPVYPYYRPYPVYRSYNFSYRHYGRFHRR